MKRMIMLIIATVIVLVAATEGLCEIKYIGSYYRSNGTFVSGHYRDVSCDGTPYNNANYLGLTD